MVMTQLKNKQNKSKEILESRKGSTRDNVWNIYKSKILFYFLDKEMDAKSVQGF